MDRDELYDKVIRALENGAHDDDIALGAAIELDILALLTSKLDAEQMAVVAFARKFWSGQGSEEERLKLLVSLCARDDAYQRIAHGKSAEASLHRLVFASLTNNTGLSDLLGEFLIGLAEDAGLTPDEIAPVFFRHLPELT